MATYREIQSHVRREYGLQPKTCWSAHVKADHGLTRGQAPIRIDDAVREQPCPPAKRAAIEATWRHFGMV